MAVTEESFLLDCWERGVCAYCKKTFPASSRVGSGKKQEGGFCSLRCFAEYHKLTLAEKHQRRMNE